MTVNLTIDEDNVLLDGVLIPSTYDLLHFMYEARAVEVSDEEMISDFEFFKIGETSSFAVYTDNKTQIPLCKVELIRIFNQIPNYLYVKKKQVN